MFRANVSVLVVGVTLLACATVGHATDGSGMVTLPLHGNVTPTGIYWFSLRIGGQEFPVTMDTG